jgi:hypothetical protein
LHLTKYKQQHKQSLYQPWTLLLRIRGGSDNKKSTTSKKKKKTKSLEKVILSTALQEKDSAQALGDAIR